MQNALRFLMKKTSFFPLINIFFSLFLKDQKLFLKETKLFFFIRNLRAFCIYFLQVHTFNQNLRAFNFCRYFFHYIQRAITVYFSDEVFSLFNAFRMPSHNNSVRMYLPLVKICKKEPNNPYFHFF